MTSPSTVTSPCNESIAVNLLELAAAALSSTVAASRPIRDRTSFAEGGCQQEENKKNARIKLDGTVVTDADGAAQRIIFRSIRRTSAQVRIVGEEEQKEMERLAYSNNNSNDGRGEEGSDHHQEEDDRIYQCALNEIYMRHRSLQITPPLAQTETNTQTEANDDQTDATTKQRPINYDDDDDADYIVDASRVSVFVDPLDGTSSYTNGDYDCVSILIAIILDNIPWFGVICKPFGSNGFSSILDTGCMAVYGGHLLDGVYIAGGDKHVPPKAAGNDDALPETLPRAILSPPSRSKGLCRDFVDYLASRGILHSEPIHSSGAGEKSMRLVLGMDNEGLWFLPKPGTSRWDVAASDALLRATGGRLTDKYGKDLDYVSVSRSSAENADGIIACNNQILHAECTRLFVEEKWYEKQI